MGQATPVQAGVASAIAIAFVFFQILGVTWLLAALLFVFQPLRHSVADQPGLPAEVVELLRWGRQSAPFGSAPDNARLGRLLTLVLRERDVAARRRTLAQLLRQHSSRLAVWQRMRRASTVAPTPTHLDPAADAGGEVTTMTPPHRLSPALAHIAALAMANRTSSKVSVSEVLWAQGGESSHSASLDSASPHDSASRHSMPTGPPTLPTAPSLLLSRHLGRAAVPALSILPHSPDMQRLAYARRSRLSSTSGAPPTPQTLGRHSVHHGGDGSSTPGGATADRPLPAQASVPVSSASPRSILRTKSAITATPQDLNLPLGPKAQQQQPRDDGPAAAAAAAAPQAGAAAKGLPSLARQRDTLRLTKSHRISPISVAGSTPESPARAGAGVGAAAGVLTPPRLSPQLLLPLRASAPLARVAAPASLFDGAECDVLRSTATDGGADAASSPGSPAAQPGATWATSRPLSTGAPPSPAAPSELQGAEDSHEVPVGMPRLPLRRTRTLGDALRQALRRAAPRLSVGGAALRKDASSSSPGHAPDASPAVPSDATLAPAPACLMDTSASNGGHPLVGDSAPDRVARQNAALSSVLANSLRLHHASTAAAAASARGSSVGGDSGGEGPQMLMDAAPVPHTPDAALAEQEGAAITPDAAAAGAGDGLSLSQRRLSAKAAAAPVGVPRLPLRRARTLGPGGFPRGSADGAQARRAVAAVSTSGAGTGSAPPEPDAGAQPGAPAASLLAHRSAIVQSVLASSLALRQSHGGGGAAPVSPAGAQRDGSVRRQTPQQAAEPGAGGSVGMDTAARSLQSPRGNRSVVFRESEESGRQAGAGPEASQPLAPVPEPLNSSLVASLEEMLSREELAWGAGLGPLLRRCLELVVAAAQQQQDLLVRLCGVWCGP